MQFPSVFKVLVYLFSTQQIDEALRIKNTDIAKELCLPPVKLHCSSKFCVEAIRTLKQRYWGFQRGWTPNHIYTPLLSGRSLQAKMLLLHILLLNAAGGVTGLPTLPVHPQMSSRPHLSCKSNPGPPWSSLIAHSSSSVSYLIESHHALSSTFRSLRAPGSMWSDCHPVWKALRPLHVSPLCFLQCWLKMPSKQPCRTTGWNSRTRRRSVSFSSWFTS